MTVIVCWHEVKNIDAKIIDLGGNKRDLRSFHRRLLGAGGGEW